MYFITVLKYLCIVIVVSILQISLWYTFGAGFFLNYVVEFTNIVLAKINKKYFAVCWLLSYYVDTV